ncbi:MAG: T9SS type A sorting domain-containing protein [Candidatus Kapabacteria bacterium]|nr:T9SS type A sorting domain-containing protein [Ignavibacteriota bacterium]MCW5884152.1 T9SS type A sorting domain-containing protein [Candidatus Kapabacteria bacterium]
MKKYLLGIIFFLIWVNFANSSPLEYFAHQDTVYGTIYDDELLAKARIRNLTDQPVEFELKFEFLELTYGHTAAVCWEVCFEFTDAPFTAPWSITLGPNEESIDFQFSGHLQSFKLLSENPIEYTEPTPGTTIVRFIFAPVGGSKEDELHYDVVFIVQDPASVDDDKIFSNVNLFPNPAVDYLRIDHQLDGPTTISVYDELGNNVKNIETEGSAEGIIIPTADLTAGSYYVRFRNGNKYHTKMVNIIR